MTLSPQTSSARMREICAKVPIIPVLEIDDVASAGPLAEALISGGLPVLEVTLRTPAALDAIREMAKAPGVVVGAGTLITPEDVRAAKAAGARFGVSPGSTPELLDAVETNDLPMLPGAASASEAMTLLARGHDALKFFPAEAAGGAPFLKSLAGPLPRLSFCPTGGLTPANAAEYLDLPNVLCAGGSWIAPKALVEAKDWTAIETLARGAARLGA